MILKWKKVESSAINEPPEVEVYPYCTFMRKNIERVEKESSNGDTVEMWQYDEVKFTPEEYEAYLKYEAAKDAVQNAADIEYLAMMLEVDLDE